MSQHEILIIQQQEAEKKRVRELTVQYLEENRKIYNQLKASELSYYIPNEMLRLENDIKGVESNLANDPYKAREINLNIKNYIYTLKQLARATKRKIEEEERIQRELEERLKEERKNELMNDLRNKLKEIQDPGLQNFMQGGLLSIKEEIKIGKIEDKLILLNKIDTLIKESKIELEKWKEEKIISSKDSIIESLIGGIEEKIEKIQDENLKNEFKDKLNKTKQFKKLDLNIINEIEQAIDDTTIKEELRREAVKSIIKQLKSQDFTVSRPTIISKENGLDYVQIIAEQPSGKHVICKLQNDGRMEYKFDNYEGKTCLKDIDRFKMDLKKIYSINLSSERVIWQNPDRIGQSKISNPNLNCINGEN